MCVRRRKSQSSYFSVLSGVRQGRAISPALFNMFVNGFLSNFRNCNAGCKVNSRFVEAIIRVDDVIILSPTVAGRQKMLACCEATSMDLSLEFNCKKCSCVAIGSAYKLRITDMSLCNDVISWANDFKYLGVNFVASR